MIHSIETGQVKSQISWTKKGIMTKSLLRKSHRDQERMRELTDIYIYIYIYIYISSKKEKRHNAFLIHASVGCLATKAQA